MNIFRLTYRGEDPYHGCYDCVKRREQQLATRDSIKYYTSRFFLAVGVAISGRHSLTLEKSLLENPFAASVAVAGCGFLCGTGVSETLGWCYGKCFLQDRLCQHIRDLPLYLVRNMPPDAQAAQAPGNTQAAQAPAGDANRESSPPVNHKSGIGFVTDRQRFRQQFSRVIET